MSGGLVLQRAFRWPGITRGEVPGMPIERRAVGTDDLAIVAHVEEHVRMVERRARADAHELRRSDLDDGNSRIILEMRNDMVGHRQNPKPLIRSNRSPFETARTILIRGVDS